MRRIEIHLSEQHARELLDLARAREATPSEIVEECLEEFLAARRKSAAAASQTAASSTPPGDDPYLAWSYE